MVTVPDTVTSIIMSLFDDSIKAEDTATVGAGTAEPTHVERQQSREVLVYVGVKGPGPICDTKPLTLRVPGNKTNEQVHEFLRQLFQNLIDQNSINNTE